MTFSQEKAGQPGPGLMGTLSWTRFHGSPTYFLKDDLGSLYKIKDRDFLRVWDVRQGREVIRQVIRFDRITTAQEGYLFNEWTDLFEFPYYRAEVIPWEKPGRVKEQSQKVSPTRWRSKKASKMARSTGKSRYASGRTGSGRSSKD